MKKMFVLFAAVALIFSFNFNVEPGFCDEDALKFDYLNFALTRVLKGVHPTANPAKAVAMYVDKPARSGEVVTAIVRVQYGGWVRHHVLTTRIKIRESEPESLVTALIIADTNTISWTSLPPYIGRDDKGHDKWVPLSQVIEDLKATETESSEKI